ncbi:MAG TPA: SpoIIE family protein phosphatase [Terriglobales bacterium]|jgi:serine phosphatase RsbU (regulator of sigma subunit)|nr:SpoIIE family protein phosphatase [Terriglobales bacterium]
MEAVKHSLLEFGVAGKTLPGYAESGDRHVYHPWPQGVLLGAIDGLGHGSQAASAAAEAASVLEAGAGENLIALVRRCHERLRGTRGVAMSLACFDFEEGSLTWMGVGNVQGVVLPADGGWNRREEALLLRPGVVGSHLPPLQAAVLPLCFGDTVVLTTDGIESNFDRAQARSRVPQETAEQLLAQYGKTSDDALIVIARYKAPSL